MAIVTAYFDESDSKTASVVSGLAATSDRWEAFHRDWSRLLAKYKLSALHMKDYAHSNGEFESWRGDEMKRAAFLRGVIEIISRRVMIAVGVVIDREAFKKTIAREPQILDFYKDEYTTAGFMSILLACKWGDNCGFTEPIDFVFDRGNSKRKNFESAYDIACLSQSSERSADLGALSFADDMKLTPLQACDFVAYETCKVYTDLDAGIMRFRKSIKSFLGRVDYRCKIPSEDGLQKLIIKIKEAAEKNPKRDLGKEYAIMKP